MLYFLELPITTCINILDVRLGLGQERGLLGQEGQEQRRSETIKRGQTAQGESGNSDRRKEHSDGIQVLKKI